MKKMKPCPFCRKSVDADDEIYGVDYLKSKNVWQFLHTCNYDAKVKPHIDTTISVYGNTMEEVIERWNRRAGNE